MLPPYIIEQIRRREEERRRREGERPALRLPLDDFPPPHASESDDADEPRRGVIVIDLVPQDDENDDNEAVEIDVAGSLEDDEPDEDEPQSDDE